MEWIKRFSHTIDYIEQNLDNEISYEKAAQIACCSINYFQRMFTYIVGLPLSEYVRRRRMTLAAFDLQNSNEKIREIGAKYGYMSPTSFHRAFYSIHGVSPSAARKEGTQLNHYPRIHFSISVSGTECLSYRIEKRDEMRFAGVTIPLPNDMSQYEKVYGKFWMSSARNGMLKRLIDLNGNLDSTICGLISDVDPQNPLYHLAVQTDKLIPKDMSEIVIPATQWIVFTYLGRKLLTYEEANRRFFTEWLPFTDFEVGQIAEMKVYPAREVYENPLEYCSKCEFWIAVKNERRRS